MNCCKYCFEDRFLQDMINHLTKSSGTCDFCNSTSVELINTKELTDIFDLVCGIYVQADDGDRLIDWLIQDWEMFAVDRPTAQSLLVEILDDGERARLTYSPSADSVSDRLDTWEILREELRCRNRFFPETEFNKARVESLLSSLVMPADDIPAEWFRARIENDGNEIPPERMGAPPADKATAGRANPVGIPYLYIASNQTTATSEVRPHPGERLSIASFILKERLNIIDLRYPRTLISPFSMQETREVAELRGDMDFLVRLGEELSTPVLPNAAAIDYIPSQYLCEFIKKSGYDGVAYRSSLDRGMNLALFDPAKSEIGIVTRVEIIQVEVTMKSVS